MPASCFSTVKEVSFSLNTDRGNDIDRVKKGAAIWFTNSLCEIDILHLGGSLKPLQVHFTSASFWCCFLDSKWAKLKFSMATFAPLSHNQDLRASCKSFIRWLIEERREIERVRMGSFCLHFTPWLQGRMEPQESPLKLGARQLCQSHSLCSAKLGFVCVHKGRFPLC